MSEEEIDDPGKQRGRYSSAHDAELRDLLVGIRDDIAQKMDSLRPPPHVESSDALLRKLIVKIDNYAEGTRYYLRETSERLERIERSREFGDSPSGHHFVKPAAQEQEDQKLLREMASQIAKLKKFYSWGKAALPVVALAGGAIHWLLTLHH